jgi:UDP-N-acetylmuramoyl-L-alanyl-D-glutamate--2,6-diaminopimelate ligase
MRPLESFSLSLDEVSQLIGAELFGAEGEISTLKITGVSHADSLIEPGDLFVALPGARKHGANFGLSAQNKGAVAVLTDSDGADIFSGLPTLVVQDPRTAAGLVAAALYREPMRDISSIGITGTNGKTTVSTLLYQLFQSAGHDTGLIGTVETRIGRESFESSRTTPEATELQALVATMREQHMRHLVMEVSSHALALKRLKGSRFNFVGFTNLTQDHLDFHKSMDEYFKTKSSLFTYDYAELGFINIDDAHGEILAKNCEIPVITLSRNNRKAQWHYEMCEHGVGATQVSLRGTGGILIETHTQLRGGYNLDNLLMAIAIAYEAGLDPIDIAALVPSLTGAMGRLESISVGQDFLAFVDYAHTPDAVSNVLSTAREFTSGKVIAVLGCGGDRDATKRPIMGEALARGADISIFTSDNPRSENPDEILREMRSDLDILEPSKVVTDREEAIAYAVSLARPGDTVLILGKGHERGQEINGAILPFDDRIVLAQAIEAKK